MKLKIQSCRAAVPLGALIALGAALTPAAAQDSWEGLAGLGLTSVSGNSETLSINGTLEASKTMGADTISLAALALYGEVGSATTSQTLGGAVGWTRQISDPWYVGAIGSVLHDDLAALDYRVTVSPFLGYKLIDNETTSLTVEAGPGYTFEKQGGLSDEYVSFRAAQAFTHALNERSTFFQSVEFLSEIDDFGSNIVKLEAGIDAKLGGNWSLRTLARQTWDSEVPSGIEDADTLVLSMLTYSFSGNEDTAAEDLEEAFESVEADDSWQTKFLGGLALTDGNSDTLLATGQLLTTKEMDPYTAVVGVTGTYGEVDGDVSAQRLGATADLVRDLNDPLYGRLGLEYVHDDLALIDYRFIIKPALGITLIDNGTTTLTLEAGPAYVFEDVGGIEDDYLALRAAERLEHQLSPSATIWQELEWLGDVDDFGNSIINAEIGIESKLTPNLSLKAYAQTSFDNEPAIGLDENDLTVVSALEYTF